MLKATARALARERFEPIDPDALLGLEPLGLRATGQRLIDEGELVIEARPLIAPVDERLFCASCGAMARLLAHAPPRARPQGHHSRRAVQGPPDTADQGQPAHRAPADQAGKPVRRPAPHDR